MALAYSLPSANGSINGWNPNGEASNYLCVDDPQGSPDDDSTYIDCTDTTATQMFAHAGFSITSNGTINSITVFSRTKMATGSGQIALRVRVNDSLYTGSYIVTLGASYSDNEEEWLTNPNTGDPWEDDEVNEVSGATLDELGCTNSGVSAGESMVTTQTYLICDYEPAGGGGGIPMGAVHHHREMLAGKR